MKRIKIAKDPQPIQRKSLISQAVDSIRDHISNGTWSTELPGERQLCDMLMISRPTLRGALETLEKEGLLIVSQGKHRRIRKQKISVQPKKKRMPQVTILCPEALFQMQPSTIYLINEVYRSLQKSGYKLNVESPSWLNFKHPDAHLEKHIKEHSSVCWALFSVSESVQKWFFKNAIPSVVSGSCYPSVNLPSVDFDCKAIIMHSVATFLRYGFRQLSLFVPERLRPGDTVAIESFLEATQQPKYPEIRASIVRVPSQRGFFKKKLDEHFQSGLPRAVFITRPLDTLYVMSYLLNSDIKIGSEVAIICSGDEFYFNHLILKPARYSTNKAKFANKFCHLLLQLAQAGSIPVKRALVMPDFEKGDTLISCSPFIPSK